MNNNEAKATSRQTLGRLLSYLKPSKGRIIFAIILIFIGVAAYAMAPLLLGFAINDLEEIFGGNFASEVTTGFLACLIAMGVCYLLYAILTWLANRFLIKATQRTIYELRTEIDAKINKLPLNYYDTTTYGDVLAILTNDVDTISTTFQQSIFEIIAAAFTLLLTIIMMIGISGWLTIVGLISIPILIIISSKITAKSQKSFDKMAAMTGELNGYVEEYYSGHNIVTVFCKEEKVNKSFKQENQGLFEASDNATFLAGVLYPLSRVLNELGYVLVLLVGGLMAIAGGLSIGMIQAFTQYLTQFQTPITEVMQITANIQNTISAADRVFTFLDEKEEIPDTDDPKFPEPLKGNVQFDHVKFGYTASRILIHDLNVDVKAGEKTAIVGPTGAGKTTFVNLVMRFYDVRGGAIRIDGVDVRDMKRSDLRKIFGMVLQDTWLYKGTIMENLRYGKLDATDEEVYEAAKKARADAFIRTLPGGYDFELAEGASNIAQGQRQLLTIARAMVADAPIMILDEATSSVDTRTEALIQEAMVEMMKGRTSFVIAHRLSTIKDSDNIMYMQDGDILEIGNHEELMAKDGLYAKLYNSQFSDGNVEDL